MPRTAPLFTNFLVRKKGEEEDDDDDDEGEGTPSRTGRAIDVIHEANMDGVRHLRNTNRLIRYSWTAVIIIFVILAIIQIFSQVRFYYRNPIATNIEAEYPKLISFPTVAICNNNQFKLTYITGKWLLNRKRTTTTGNEVDEKSNIFDKVLENAGDMDAVKFLKNAAHTKAKMILGCKWPNGTECRLADFRPVWTMTGLCWAINTNEHSPITVSGSGAGHGLQLTLNVESYERIEACSPHLRTTRLSGVKILIYNQTDVPESSMKGVNVPAGYSMDIPFKMQHRHKLAGSSCIEEGIEHEEARKDFLSPMNIRTCTIRKYLSSIEERCNCSMRNYHFGIPSPDDPVDENLIPSCTVQLYFSCVLKVVEEVREEGASAGCLPPCRSIEYTAWQDMSRLPANIMPPLIEEVEEEDEDDVKEEDDDEELEIQQKQTEDDKKKKKQESGDIHLKCDQNQYLTDIQVARIKRQAHKAFEKQSRYQEDVNQRTHRLIRRFNATANKLKDLGWGWSNSDLRVPLQRLINGSLCFSDIMQGNRASALSSRPSPPSEEKKTSQLFMLLDPGAHANPSKYKTIGALKEVFGSRLEPLLREWSDVFAALDRLYTIFDSSSYTTSLVANLTRMDRIFELVEQYAVGHLQRRVWAEKMQSRLMRHFFDEEFNDGWYQPLMRDLDHTLNKNLQELEATIWPNLQKSLANGNAVRTGAVLLFGDATAENEEKVRRMLGEMYECAMGDVLNMTASMMKELKRNMREFQSAYNNLFKKELPDYLENYEFGQKFESENFAMVNIFMHQMHIEHWRQYRTYTLWSLACDVGGALGLFLGASLLTLIEVIYLCFKHGLCQRKWAEFRGKKSGRHPGFPDTSYHSLPISQKEYDKSIGKKGPPPVYDEKSDWGERETDDKEDDVMMRSADTSSEGGQPLLRPPERFTTL